jgi:RNA polymerase sigma-70 factor, ECF subfamily
MSDQDKLRLFEILAQEHEPMLLAYILSLISDPVLAEDIAQQTFLIAFRKISTLRKTESFPAWLRGIARREVFAALRHRQMEVPLDPAILDAMEDAFQALENQEQAQSWEERFALVEDFFKRLPEALQKVCQLHYFEDRKAREIADTLEVGLSAVLKRLERWKHWIALCRPPEGLLMCPARDFLRWVRAAVGKCGSRHLEIEGHGRMMIPSRWRRTRFRSPAALLMTPTGISLWPEWHVPAGVGPRTGLCGARHLVPKRGPPSLMPRETT